MILLPRILKITIINGYFMPQFANLPIKFSSQSKSVTAITQPSISSSTTRSVLSNLQRSASSLSSNQPLSNSQPDPSRGVYQQSLAQTIDQRRRFKAAEYSTKNPIQDHVKERGELLERRIGHLQQQLKSSSS